MIDDMTDEINNMETGNAFVSSHETRLNQFGKFTSDGRLRTLYISQQQLFYFILRFICIARKVYALKKPRFFKNKSNQLRYQFLAI